MQSLVIKLRCSLPVCAFRNLDTRIWLLPQAWSAQKDISRKFTRSDAFNDTAASSLISNGFGWCLTVSEYTGAATWPVFISPEIGFKLIPQTTTRGPLDDSMALRRTVAERQKLNRVEEPLGHPRISPASPRREHEVPASQIERVNHILQHSTDLCMRHYTKNWTLSWKNRTSTKKCRHPLWKEPGEFSEQSSPSTKLKITCSNLFFHEKRNNWTLLYLKKNKLH